ncbi:TIGR03089 family protein [Aeromicrobium sp. Leaf272]|uniref:TIGR03089 family protein n=1 Tax=Aeromicrobium sp. Leaf272 TaxID=1736317 RepID=UPI0006F6E74E|nr:TIGR03089 family protein [Aeromicrobium sp. Leaf272]KQP27218.1 hypothetical protein ASF38_05480 [Aeromicrobium sp. Leaf272]
MPTLADLLPAVREPGRPLLTWDDRTTGERVELSATTTANWVAKTASLLVDELDAEIGTRVRIGLPSHWLRFVWLLSSWTVGAVVVDRDADIGVSGPDLVGDEPVRLAASLRPLGGPFVSPPEGFVDLATVVPGQPDAFTPLDVPHAGSAALDLADADPLDHAGLVELGAPDPRRVLVEPGDLRRDALLLVSALRGGGSLVVVAGADADQLERVAQQERAHVQP